MRLTSAVEAKKKLPETKPTERCHALDALSMGRCYNFKLMQRMVNPAEGLSYQAAGDRGLASVLKIVQPLREPAA